MKKNRKRERGAVIVEFAIVVPILVLLFQGTVEFGLMWRESSNLAGAVSQSTRSMAALGGNGYSDKEGVLALRTSLGSNSRVAFDDDDYIIVYDATGSPAQAAINKQPCDIASNSNANDLLTYQKCTRYPAYYRRSAPRNDADEPQQECPDEIIPESDRPFGWYLGNYAEEDDSNRLLTMGADDCGVATSLFGKTIIYSPCKRIWAISGMQNLDFANRAKIGVEIQGTYKSLTGLFGGVKIKQSAVYQVVPCDVKDSLPGGACSQKDGSNAPL